MLFITHLLFGLLCGLFALDFLNVENKIVFIFMVLLASSLPDADHRNGWIARKLFPLKIVGLIFRHRGIVHSLFFAFLLGGILFYYGMEDISYGLLIGYLSHLVSDSLTRSGVIMLYPFSKIKFRGYIKTGGIGEKIFLAVILIILSYRALF